MNITLDILPKDKIMVGLSFVTEKAIRAEDNEEIQVLTITLGFGFGLLELVVPYFRYWKKRKKAS